MSPGDFNGCLTLGPSGIFSQLFMCECDAYLQAFYRGNGTNVLRLLPEISLKYAINDQLKVLFAPQDGRSLGLQGKLAAGATTGAPAHRAQAGSWDCKCAALDQASFSNKQGMLGTCTFQRSMGPSGPLGTMPKVHVVRWDASVAKTAGHIQQCQSTQLVITNEDNKCLR